MTDATSTSPGGSRVAVDATQGPIGSVWVLAESGATDATDAARLPHRRPASIPSSQAYYWTGAWQRDELLAAAELERGEALRFENVRDAMRWLLSAEE